MQVYTVLLDDGEHEHFLGVFPNDIEAVIWIEEQEGYQKSWYEYKIVKSTLGEGVDLLKRNYL